MKGKLEKLAQVESVKAKKDLGLRLKFLFSQKELLTLQGSHERGLVLDKVLLGRQIEDLVFLTVQSLQGTLHCNLKSYGYRKELGK